MEWLNGRIWQLLTYHRYFRYTGLYKFIAGKTLTLSIFIAVIAIALFLIETYLIDINFLLHSLTSEYEKNSVFILFFISETLLGLIPPDIFIAWAQQLDKPLFYILILSVLSYTGGVFAYIIGRSASKISFIHKRVVWLVDKHLNNIRKWGGVFIFIAAMFPLPFSTVCLMAGTVKFPFRFFLLFALFRIPRFFVYSIIIDKMF